MLAGMEEKARRIEQRDTYINKRLPDAQKLAILELSKQTGGQVGDMQDAMDLIDSVTPHAMLYVASFPSSESRSLDGFIKFCQMLDSQDSN